MSSSNAASNHARGWTVDMDIEGVSAPFIVDTSVSRMSRTEAIARY